MALFTQTDIVQYACTCGQLKPISHMYFCRHCLKLRCGFCVCHEVDSHFCPSCQEILPSAEARLKKNRYWVDHRQKSLLCNSCFDCPSCQNTLSLRATTVTVRDSEDPKKVNGSKKQYYHSCFFCRWTTRDVGLPDHTAQVVACGWPQKEGSNTHRISSLMEHARMLGLLERHEREQREKKFTSRSRRGLTLLAGLTAAQARKRAGLPPDLPAPSTIKESLAEFQPAVAKEEVEQLPQDIFTAKLDLNQVTTLTQRLAQLEFQPVSAMDLVPAHKHMSIKRSQRCRECDHNVSKPELNPASIKFKIQQAAYFHVPEVRLVTVEPLRPGEESELLIVLCNPSQHQTSVCLLTLEEADAEDEAHQLEEEAGQAARLDSLPPQGEAPSSLTSLTRSVSVLEEPRPIKINITGDIRLPKVVVTLPPKDDAAEYDDAGDTQQFQDDPKIVVHRKANRASLRLTVTPHVAAVGQDCRVGFALQYSYMKRITAPATAPLEQKEPQKVTLRARVFVKFGKVLSGGQE